MISFFIFLTASNKLEVFHTLSLFFDRELCSKVLKEAFPNGTKNVREQKFFQMEQKNMHVNKK